MLKYDININIELDEEAKKNLIKYLKQLIDRFVEENSITSLHKIIFTDDWDKEISDYQESHGLPIEYTNTKYGSASAKTLKIKIEKKTKCVIFFRKEILLAIIQQEGFGILHLFHELSHIYYFEKIGNSLDHLNEKYALSSNLTESTKKFALIMWEEYFASRFLCRYLFGSTDCYIGILIEQYKIIKRDIEKEIDDYRYHSDINKLFILAKEKMTLLNTYMSYSCGMICGLNDDRNSLLNDITKLLKESTGLFEIWEKMYIKYDEIYMKFPTLENIDSKLAELTALFIEMYNHFGIYPKQLDNGQLYIDVPL